MAKKLESRTTLTEFPPLSPESKSQTFSIRNLFFRNKDKPIPHKEPEPKENSPPNISDSPQFIYSLPGDAKNIAVPGAENRGMTGILGKIMDNIVDKKKKGLQNYKDSDFKQYWMPDSNCKECYDCGDKFTTFRRRHHCRVCGQIFCWKCCSQEIPGDLIGYTEDLRVCSYCCKMVLSCVHSLDSQLEDDSHSFHDNQLKKFRLDPVESPVVPNKQTAISPARRKSSVIGFREEDFAKAKPFKSTLESISFRGRPKVEGPIQDRAELKKLMHQLVNSVQSIPLWKQEYRDHHIKVILGCDIVDWLVAHDALLSRNDAVNIGQAFIDAQLFECLMPQQKFVDGNVFYKPLEQSQLLNPDENSNEIQESVEPLWVKEIKQSDSFIFKAENNPTSPMKGSLTRLSSTSSTFYLDLDVKESRVSLFKSSHEDKSPTQDVKTNTENSESGNAVSINPTALTKFVHDVNEKFTADNLDASIMKSVISSRTWHRSHLREDDGEKAAFENLNLAYKEHEATLLNQLLSNKGLSLSWADIILSIIHHVVDAVHPDVKNDADDMDIRQYVQFKKIPGGSKSESSIISGVVFSKTVAHKKMRQRIQNPSVLLLSSAISYQRVENKLSSLDPILMQEFEYLKNIIGKLTVFKPDILLVEKTVSRLAQEMLLDLGVTVALNVKYSVMERVARCTQAAIVSTVDEHLGRPQLGTCAKYKVRTYSMAGKSKTLMIFDGCPENLGCTVLLRGGSANELKKVKQVVQFMIYVAYNWSLERSFLMDEFVYQPSPVLNDSIDEEENMEVVTAEMKYTNASEELPKKTKDETGRKLEAESISDFSDPLRAYQLENDVFSPPDNCDFKVAHLPPVTFSKLLDDVVLCCSLNVKLPLPFLETETGKKCDLRKFFPQEIYWSKHIAKDSEQLKPFHQEESPAAKDMEDDILIVSKDVEVLPKHRLIHLKITNILSESEEVQSLLADFRARGGTLKRLCPHEQKNNSLKEHDKRTESNPMPSEQEKKVDALDPFNHQALAVLFSSYSCASDNAPNYCVNPWVVKMEFYGSNDITLGGFLDKYCFRASYNCPSNSCMTPMTEHVRKFVHGMGCVHILLHELTSGVAENNILMWSWCHTCKKATPVVSMSQDTWSFSFAKYLELRFYASDYKRRGPNEACNHSLHHDHYQYFAQNNLVAIFKYTPVLIWEVIFPAFVITVSDRALSIHTLKEQIRNIGMKGLETYSTLQSTLFSLHSEFCDSNSEDYILDMLHMLEEDTSGFRKKVEEIKHNLTSPTVESLQLKSIENIEQNKEVCAHMWNIEDEIMKLKFLIAKSIQDWNPKIEVFNTGRKKEQKLHSKLTSQSSRASDIEDSSKTSEDPAHNSPASSLVDSKSSTPTSKFLQKLETPKELCGDLCHDNCIRRFSGDSGQTLLTRRYSLPDLRAYHLEENYFCKGHEMNNSTDSFYTYGDTPSIVADLMVSKVKDYELDVVSLKGTEEDVIYSQKHHERSKSETEAVLLHGNQTTKHAPEKQTSVDSKTEKRSMKTLLSQLIPNPTFVPIECPFSPLEHLLLPVPSKLPVVVHEEEPSSIIAYALSTDDYEQKLQEMKLNLNTLNISSQKDSLTSSPLLKHRPLKDANDDAFDFSMETESSKRGSGGAKSTPNVHLEVQFSDPAGTKFYCRVYYAEQFRKLRSLVFPEGEERFARALAHCVQWVARGGKSGSLFCKTHDDRFILKQTKSQELQSFMDLAPAYFQYLNKSYLEQKPTALAKIVGIYRVGFKNSTTNAATKMDLLVMENLFYGRCVNRRYDLKGSVRNRLVHTSGEHEEDIVLLDENLLKITCDNPFYIRPHSKAVMSQAISNDTQFLLDQSVMDYSLLVGLEEEKGQFVVGIIDYIRTFTWDKKVEMLIKSSGLLGGHGKLPTVVSPEIYRIRFCDAMDSYFLATPDHWTGLGKSLDGTA